MPKKNFFSLSKGTEPPLKPLKKPRKIFNSNGNESFLKTGNDFELTKYSRYGPDDSSELSDGSVPVHVVFPIAVVVSSSVISSSSEPIPLQKVRYGRMIVNKIA